MSVDRAAYWARTLREFVGLDVVLIASTLDLDVGLHDQDLRGRLLALGANHARLAIADETIDVRYDRIRSAQIDVEEIHLTP